MKNEQKIKWYTKVGQFLSKWVSRVILAVLSVAGLLHLMGGVDAVISWPISIVFTALLIKETL